MNSNETRDDGACSCSCHEAQTRSTAACPACGARGMTVGIVTPQHLLKKGARDRLVPSASYNFCESSDCEVVYYSEDGGSTFERDALRSAVTCKDDTPETPLCHCFQVLRRDALAELERSGSCDVFRMIRERMRPGQACFCEKSNPRGESCAKDILAWLEERGVGVPVRGGSGCC